MDATERETLERDGKVYKSGAGAAVTATISLLLRALTLVLFLVLSPLLFVLNRFVGDWGSKGSSSSQAPEEKFAKLTGVTPQPLGERKYDIVLFGSTGFTGKLAALYVAKTYGSSELRWAIGKI